MKREVLYRKDTKLHRIRRWIFSCAGCTLLMLMTASMASGKALLFVISNDYPPYEMLNEKGVASGIHIDMLRYIAMRQGFKLSVTRVPIKRLERYVKQGGGDVFALSIAWATNPENFIYSIPVTQVKEVIFYPIEKPLVFDRLDDLFGKHLITINHYHYPILDPYINSRRIRPFVTENERTALTMLNHGRADGAVLSELLGKWLIKDMSLEGRFGHTTGHIQEIIKQYQ